MAFASAPLGLEGLAFSGTEGSDAVGLAESGCALALGGLGPEGGVLRGGEDFGAGNFDGQGGGIFDKAGDGVAPEIEAVGEPAGQAAQGVSDEAQDDGENEEAGRDE